MKKNNNGFSLVELIIVIAIMAVLVGVLAPQFIKYVEQSRRSRDIATAQEIREAYLADIADGVGASLTATPVASKPTALNENPTVAGSLNGSWSVDFNVSAGTCSVYLTGCTANTSGGTSFELTNASVASVYKTAAAT
jgi:type IV pilus assembly protein PilA